MLSATLDAPGSKATGWRLPVSVAGGDFAVQVKAEDVEVVARMGGVGRARFCARV